MSTNPAARERSQNRIILFLIGAFCFCYSIWTSNFAELHFRIPFLTFPVFVGEILLACCLILLAINWTSRGRQVNRWYYLFGAYILWMLSRAFEGYFTLGPLAFRNAALFYYPLFAILGYKAYHSSFFDRRLATFLFIVLCAALLLNVVTDYYQWAYLVFVIVLACHLREKKFLYIGSLVALYYLLAHNFLFHSSRSHMAGLVVAVSFLICFSLSILPGTKKWLKFMIAVVLLVVLSAAGLKLADPNAVHSLTAVHKLIDRFKIYEFEIAQKKADFIPPALEVNLYHQNESNLVQNIITKLSDQRTPEETGQLKNALVRQMLAMFDPYTESVINETRLAIARQTKIILDQAAADIEQKKILIMIQAQESIKTYSQKLVDAALIALEESGNVDMNNIERIQAQMKDKLEGSIATMDHSYQQSLAEFLKKQNEKLKEDLEQKTAALEAQKNEVIGNAKDQIEYRSLEVAENNIFFRLFIWRDMIMELWENKALFGVSFGKPQRSPSLEMLGWATVEWRRDGWITPHNSYLHMIYRAGIVGLILIGSMFAALFSLVRMFARERSLIGGLLVSNLVYWFMITNFLVFLEFPYNAIPFWTFFGMTWAYARQLNPRKSEGAKAIHAAVKA